jgi:REP element-mobilizing transposase RayT
MSEASVHRLATVRQGAYLPHWTLDGADYHVVFRLVDSLPAAVVEDYRRERAALLAKKGDPANPVAHDQLQELFRTRLEQLLDTGRGACWLARTEIAGLIAGALRHFSGTRYKLHAWCVMPNHVHVVVQPLGSHKLPDILHSWKSYTATAANRQLKRRGEFWQKESYDHLIRDADELDLTVRYVQANPAGAGLRNWPWVWPSPPA